MRSNYLFTSESVSEGHPDKVCDRISDAVVDAYLGSHQEVDLGVVTGRIEGDSAAAAAALFDELHGDESGKGGK